MGRSDPDSGQHRRGVSGNVLAASAVVLAVAAAVFVLAAYRDDIRYAAEQRRLSGDLPPRTVAAAVESTPVMDFTDWARLDEAYWRGLEPGGAFGTIVAPAAGIDAAILKGAEQAQLDLSPGWITQTDLPGPEGNCAISGHRVTHGHPFRNMDRLKPGATIDVYSPYRRYRYVVFRRLSVTPDHVEVVAHTERPQLTLTTCDPPGSAQRRLVIQARLVEVRLLASIPGRTGTGGP